MMRLGITFDKTITIFNAHRVSVKDELKWYPTIITGVSWHGGQGVTDADPGVSPSDSYVVRIPLEAFPDGFLYTLAFNKLTPEEVAEHWTVRNSDVVCLGEYTELVDNISTLLREIDQAFVIRSWTDNRRGFPMLQHIRINGR